MNNNCESILLDSSLLNRVELLQLCENKISNSLTEDWEIEIFTFLRDWFSNKDTIIVNTSGSTGSPKLIEIKKKHMVTSAKSTLNFFELRKGDSAWLCLPASYIAGKMMIVRAIVGGLKLYYTKPTSEPSINERIDFVAMVPNQVFGLISTSNGRKLLKSIGRILIGGSDITNQLREEINNHQFPNIWHSYGMTETITHIALCSMSNTNEKSVFVPLPDVIISTSVDSQLVVDYPGIGIKSLVTNDIVHINNDGSFYVLGRIDNVVISGGVKLFPEVIENKYSSLITKNFFFGGLPDTILGEKLVLFIEDADKTISLDDLIPQLGKKILKYEIPREIVYLDKFSRTPNGKLNRKQNISNYLNQ
mgnify:CR=1 FL=1